MNELTRKLDALKITTIIRPYRNINLKERYLFADISIPDEPYNKKIKITWDENYEDVKVTPWITCFPRGSGLMNFIFLLMGNGRPILQGGTMDYSGNLCINGCFFIWTAATPTG
jgi:hypothetical protein